MNDPLKDRLHLLSLVVDRTSDGIAVVELDGQLIYANSAFARMHGYEPEEVLGNFLSIFHTEDQMPAVNEANQLLKEAGQFEGEVWHAKRDGEPFLTYMRNSLLHDSDGKVIGIIGTMVDMTQQKQAEERLLLLSQITEQVSDSVLITDMDFKITYANQAFQKLYEYSVDEVLGVSPGDFNAGPNVEEVQNDICKAVSSGRTWSGEVLNRKKSGALFSIELLVFPVTNEQGEILAYAGSQRDITARKRAEEKLQKTARELKARQQELIDKNAALTEILDNIEQQRKDYKHRICRELEQELLPVLQKARAGSKAIPGRAVDGLESSIRAILSKDLNVFKDYLSKLTPRELQICDMLRQGKTSKEIADQLNLSPVTVNTHRQRIRKKLGITNKSLNLSVLLRMY